MPEHDHEEHEEHDHEEAFVDLTVTLEEDQLEELKKIAAEYKEQLNQNWDVSAVIRDALRPNINNLPCEIKPHLCGQSILPNLFKKTPTATRALGFLTFPCCHPKGALLPVLVYALNRNVKNLGFLNNCYSV